MSLRRRSSPHLAGLAVTPPVVCESSVRKSVRKGRGIMMEGCDIIMAVRPGEQPSGPGPRTCSTFGTRLLLFY